MDPTQSRLPPPPKHPQSLPAIPSPVLHGHPSPNLGHSQPPVIPPRPSHSSLPASDETIISGVAQNASSSQELRPPIPPKHPSLLGQSSDSSPPILASEHHPIPPTMSMRPSGSDSSITSGPISCSGSQTDIPEASHVDSPLLRPQAENSTPEEAPNHILSQDTESAFERSLSERELRDLYDDEEIDRFLRLFSAHVNEVRLQDSSAANTQFSAQDEDILVGHLETHDTVEEGEWTSVGEPTPSLQSSKLPSLCLSERIAVNYIIPFLPPLSPPIPPFTTGRLKLTVQRLFLILEPGYRFFISHLVHLATWQDKPLSLRYCIGFWILWLYNHLLPSFVLYLLYTLLHHKMHPYPTFEELREHRDSIDKAKEFGDILQMRSETYPVFGVKEAWRMFRVFNKSRKMTKDSGKSVTEGADPAELQATVLDDPKERKKESNIKAIALQEVIELVDTLERVKNIFLWRRPAASYVFGLVLSAVFLMTLLLPAQYLAKLVYFVSGVAFWHVPPIILAIPPEDRRRIVSVLYEVPTDADYATELISQRVASGQDIKPLKRRKRSGISDSSSRGDSVDSFETFTNEKWSETETKRKLKKGVAIFTTLASEGAKMVTGEPFLHKAFAPEAAKEADGAARSYPAQYGKTPGVITMTSTTLFFTVLMSSNAKVVIPLDQIIGIKKGFSKAISIQLKESHGGGGPTVQRFLWVYERDDLFARLVGLGGRKWVKV